MFPNIIEIFNFKPGYRSDHSSVVVELKLNSFERGHGLWKFDNNLLHDIGNIKKVKQKNTTNEKIIFSRPGWSSLGL